MFTPDLDTLRVRSPAEAEELIRRNVQHLGLRVSLMAQFVLTVLRDPEALIGQVIEQGLTLEQMALTAHPRQGTSPTVHGHRGSPQDGRSTLYLLLTVEADPAPSAGRRARVPRA